MWTTTCQVLASLTPKIRHFSFCGQQWDTETPHRLPCGAETLTQLPFSAALSGGQGCFLPEARVFSSILASCDLESDFPRPGHTPSQAE